ncbi:MAG: hypothetical protein PVJ67_06735 [Candidatus Pacearchaeota archaeon]|jgi:hypothetical protein
MIKQKNKFWKNEITNVLLAFWVSAIAFFSFNYFKPGIEEMLSAIIFFLVLILLKQK